MKVEFTDDIPKIERQGFERSSKYDELLDACVQNAGKAARITVDSQGAASSRATSIKNAAESHEAETNESGVFIVATRSGEGEDEYHVFTKFVEAGTEEYDEEMESRQKRAAAAKKRQATKRAKAESNGDDAEATEEAPKPKAKKKARRKASA